MKNTILRGNNIELLKQYENNYFDSIVTDPPYGLGKEPNASELMKNWIEHGYHEIQGKGFMGKEWDAFVPQPLFWKEVFRVLKPGGHVLAFFGTRTYDWGVMAMRFAGFEVRDCIQWLYGSGFPKSHNIGKVIGNVEWQGWGSALKPANEPIVLARKPLEKGLSISENVLKWGTGGINIDGCRINYSELNKPIPQLAQGKLKVNSSKTMFDGQSFNKSKTEAVIGGSLDGRFPANIILTHHPKCECKQNEEKDWNCHPDCPIKILDKQSGITKSQRSERGNIIDNNVYGKYKEQEDTLRGHTDKGGASRFFYVAKASKSERNKGLSGFEAKRSSAYGYEIGLGEKGEGMFKDRNPIKQNFHPTVKPIKLMQYLVRLVTPQNGIVLDPFCGSGTTGIACKIEGFEFVGMEQDTEYAKIAETRIKNWENNL